MLTSDKCFFSLDRHFDTLAHEMLRFFFFFFVTSRLRESQRSVQCGKIWLTVDNVWMTPAVSFNDLRLEATVHPAGPRGTTHSSGPFLFIPFCRHWKASKAFLTWKLWGATQQILVRVVSAACTYCLPDGRGMSISSSRIILTSL